MRTTLGHLMLDSALPEEHRTHDVIDKKTLGKLLVTMAREDPAKYAVTVTKLKRLGDEVATLEGVSVGLDDIKPVHGVRDKIMDKAQRAYRGAKTDGQRETAILDAQTAMLDHTKDHPGSMTRMALSGSRGNISQLMKIVASPIVAVDASGKIIPWMITRSYGEGLSAADHWVANNEARVNVVKSQMSVAEPGDVHNIASNLLYPFVVTQEDCGTKRGIKMQAHDPQILDRHLADGRLVTTSLLSELRKADKPVSVRSPLTCDAEAGLCAKCYGLDERKIMPSVGTSLGTRAAQAMAEPLTQFSLNAKHGVRIVKGAAKAAEGIVGVRQLLEVPESFFNKAALAEAAGKVTRVAEAGHGGYHVDVGQHQHYVSPGLRPLVRVGDHVEAGQVLSEGTPKPNEIVQHRGIGEGRRYLVDALHAVYKAQGVDLDKRHLEIIARAELGHVEVTDPGKSKLLRGDLIPYAHFRDAALDHVERVPFDKAHGRVLGEEIDHHLVGTPLIPPIMDLLHASGVKHLDVITHDGPRAEPVVKAMARVPLLNPDWLARMSHRYLKDSIMRGVHTGDVSDLHGVHPVPAYAYGAEFGQGTGGRY